MDIIELREFCLTFKGATETTPFGPDFLAYKVMGKMFACIDLDRPWLVTLKCAPDYAEELRDRYAGVEPAWHFNKKHWNQVWIDRDVPPELVRSLVAHSLDEVLKRLPRKTREAYARQD